MRSLVLLALVLTLSCVSCVPFPFRRPVRVANHGVSSSPPPSYLYPGLASSTQATAYTIGQVLRQPELIGDTKNISWIFNITATHLGHMPELDNALNSTGGPGHTLMLPDDNALRQASFKWQEMLKEKFNFTSFDITATWNMTETNQTIEKEVMKWVHAGIAWSVVQGNHSLFNLSSENLLPTMLNDTEFVLLGKNNTTGMNNPQFMRVIKGSNVTVYGVPITKRFPEMTHDNRTDVMVVSGSGIHLENIAHVYKEIVCSNGRVFILDKAVDFPFNTTDVLKSENATMFLAALSHSKLNDTVNNTPNMTILAPSDDAIKAAINKAAISNETYRKWTPEMFKAVLEPYIIPGAVYGKDLNTTTTLQSLGGHTLNITHTGNETLINGTVGVIQTDILTRNGVVHIINSSFEEIEKDIISKLPK